MRNRCRSSLEHHGNLTVSEEVQNAEGMISNIEVQIR